MIKAVLSIKGKQYEVREGDTILVDGLLKEGQLDPKVVLIVDDGKIIVGKPFVEKASVDIKVLKNVRGDKVRVLKYKAKSRYRRRRGFRLFLTKIEIVKISY